jgi:sulfur-carrier protein
MPTVNIPAALRPLAGAATQAEVGGATLGEVIDALEALYPGVRARLVDGERIRPGMAVFIDGVQSAPRLSTRVSAAAEIYFAPAVAGG